MKCILINKSKLEHQDDKNYTDDILETNMPLEAFPDISSVTNPEPYKYHYVDIKNRKPLFNMLNAKYLHVSKCIFYKLKEGTLYMITPCIDKWNYKSFITFARETGMPNSKAEYINKQHSVRMDALFFLHNGKQVIDLTREYFMKNVYANAFIKIPVHIDYNHPIVNEYNKANAEYLNEEKRLENEHKKAYDLYISDILNGVISYNDVEKFIGTNKYHDELMKVKNEKSELKRTTIWELNKDKLKEVKALIDINIKDDKTKLNELQANFDKAYNNIRKIVDKETRYKYAQEFLKQLMDNFYLNIESLYMHMAGQLYDVYYERGFAWYNSGFYFHSCAEYQNCILRLELGASIDTDDKKSKYLMKTSTKFIEAYQKDKQL